MDSKISFLAFHLVYAKLRGWKVPDIHVRACDWLEHCGLHAVMLCFRGFAKSTLLAEYNAWRYYKDHTYRILHQGADDQMAYKTSRDTQRVLRTHPFCKGLLPDRPGPVEQWWVSGSNDQRNASMFAKGITSTTTSSRADECQNDDVEVPKNITNPENREKMRDRLGEQVHIMVPGARHLFIGTPHTHDSLYDEHVRLGANLLKIQMFGREHRIENATNRTYVLPFVPEVIFFGIHEGARLLAAGVDFRLVGKQITFTTPPNGLVDLYAECAWPERFDAKELLSRRKKTRTINAWDSQYQLHSKPLTQTRLDPDRIKVYDVEPVLRYANGELGMWLGRVRIVGAAVKWDPASGKLRSDVSSLSVLLQDEQGRRYWHRAIALTGDIAETNERGDKIVGGQVLQIVEIVKALALPRVRVESNGVGAFAGSHLKTALKQARLQCGVSEEPETGNKNKRILDAIEGPLTSGVLWAHISVAEGAAWDQMRDWNPGVTDQPDDHLDSLAGAITQTPERIGRAGRDLNLTPGKAYDWRPDAGVFEVETEF